MVSIWSNEQTENVTCKVCSSIYAVIINRFPVRDKDFFKCEVCNQLLKEWNSTSCPSFVLIKRGNKPPT